MDKIEAIKNTKLKFHRIYTTFILPVGVVGNLAIFIQNLTLAYSEATLLNIWGATERAIYVILSIIAMRGLTWFRKSGLVCLYILQVISSILSCVMAYTMYSSGNLTYAFSYIASASLSILLIGYYAKRRKLFSREGLTNDEMLRYLHPMTVAINKAFGGEAVRTSPVVEESELAEEIEEIEEAEVVGEYDCPKCGRHITDGAIFCPRCGAQTRKVNR